MMLEIGFLQTIHHQPLYFAQVAHIRDAERVIDFTDRLPKFSDVPEEAGGSGQMIEKPSQSGWCSRPK